MSRAALAALLYLAGIGLPLGGWLQAGAAEARRGEQALVDRARSQADEVVRDGAARLAARMEVLRSAEERRPYYHYQSLFHDPNGASAGPSVVTSPLSQAPADPLVEVYFQINAAGRVTLPMLNEEIPSDGASPGEPPGVEPLRRLRERLQGDARRITEAEAPPRQAALLKQQAIAPSKEARKLKPSDGSLGSGDSLGSGSSQGNEMQKIASDSYAQNLQASKIYLDLKNAKKPSYQVPESYGTTVEISTDPLSWRLASLDGETRLLGLRRATTPDGALMQGFVLSQDAMLGAIDVARARLTTAAPLSPQEASAAVGATGLWVVLDRAGEEAMARAVAREEWQQFLRLFGLVALAVTAAGGLVVVVVARAERLASERSRFAASAAHELRTPLAGLRMYAEMLSEGLGDPSKHQDYARRVALEAERLGRVVGNVLGFTRLERNALVVKPQVGDLAAFVEESTLKLMPWAEAMGIALDLSIEATPAVRFDPDAVVQVLQNLIDNAEKYGRNAPDRAIVVATRALDGGAEFAVIDRGPGVPDRLRRSLFAPFARSANPDDPPGLGLGLSLAHALVEAHRGKLTHEPTPGGGATFRAWFPPGAAAA